MRSERPHTEEADRRGERRARAVRVGVEHRSGRPSQRRPELGTEQTDIDRALHDGDDARDRRAGPQAVQHDWRPPVRGFLPRPFEPERADQLCEHDVQNPDSRLRR